MTRRLTTSQQRRWMRSVYHIATKTCPCAHPKISASSDGVPKRPCCVWDRVKTMPPCTTRTSIFPMISSRSAARFLSASRETCWEAGQSAPNSIARKLSSTAAQTPPDAGPKPSKRTWPGTHTRIEADGAVPPCHRLHAASPNDIWRRKHPGLRSGCSLLRPDDLTSRRARHQGSRCSDHRQ